MGIVEKAFGDGAYLFVFRNVSIEKNMTPWYTGGGE
jgi:hypothetical protein